VLPSIDRVSERQVVLERQFEVEVVVAREATLAVVSAALARRAARAAGDEVETNQDDGGAAELD
jgi:hypothetical protein